MAYHASGPFEVKLAPQPADGYADGAALGRMTIDIAAGGTHSYAFEYTL